MIIFNKSMLQYIFSFDKDPIAYIICIILALIPTLIWYFIFGYRHKHNLFRIFLTFILGIFSSFIIGFYQYLWGGDYNFIFFNIEFYNFSNGILMAIGSTLVGSILYYFLLSICIGLIEEYSKHWVVKISDNRIFRSVDDVIEYSIIAALGFAFIENVAYFYSFILESSLVESIDSIILRSIFTVFVHIFCSGIYGYFYGLAYFSEPVCDSHKKGFFIFIPRILHVILHLKKEIVYRDEMISFGLIVSSLLHGLYNFSLSVGNNLSFTIFYGYELAIHNVLLPLVLIFGFSLLSYLLNKKEDNIIFGNRVYCFKK